MATITVTPGSIAEHNAYAPSPRPLASTAPYDPRRGWLWGFLALVALSQLYFVRELLGAFLLFALAFAVVAAVVVTLYMLHHIAQLAAARLSAAREPVLQVSPVRHESKPA